MTKIFHLLGFLKIMFILNLVFLVPFLMVCTQQPQTRYSARPPYFGLHVVNPEQFTFSLDCTKFKTLREKKKKKNTQKLQLAAMVSMLFQM